MSTKSNHLKSKKYLQVIILQRSLESGKEGYPDDAILSLRKVTYPLLPPDAVVFKASGHSQRPQKSGM
jgi:hypothetical protein